MCLLCVPCTSRIAEHAVGPSRQTHGVAVCMVPCSFAPADDGEHINEVQFQDRGVLL